MVKNRFVGYLCDFLKKSKFYALNGRFSALENGFTSVLSKGNSVVDFICVLHDQLQYIRDFCVRSVTDMIEHYNVTPDATTSLPDYSLLLCSISVSDYHAFQQSYLPQGCE